MTDRHDSLHPARRLWHLIEPLHAVTYFAPACRDAFGEAGLSGFWMGYFAGRAAPMGRVGAAGVTATFMNFAPGLVARAIPEAWTRTTPEQLVAIRADAAAIALRQIVPNLDEHARRCVPLLEQACRAARGDGRPLAAANLALALPEDPAARLWQLCTALREHRGDGHVAALVTAGIGGREALVLATAAGLMDRATMQAARGWSDPEWDDATDGLVERGWLDPDGTLSAQGQTTRTTVEARTDDLAMQPFEDGLTDTGRDLLTAVLAEPARRVLESGLIPTPNPIGLPVRR